MNVAVILLDSARPPADLAAILEWLSGRAASGDSCHVAELRGLARSSVDVDGVTHHRGSAYAPEVAAAADILVVTHEEGIALAGDAQVIDATAGFVNPDAPAPKPAQRKKAA